MDWLANQPDIVIFPGNFGMNWRNRRVKVRFRDIKEELLLGEPVDEPG